MTSKNYSDNKKIITHSFASALKSLIPISAIGMLLMLYVMSNGYLPFWPFARELGNGYRYQIYSLFLPNNQVFVHIIIICTAVLIGLINFNYLFKKNRVNVYMSLGMTRKKQFLSRYFAGVIMLLPQIVIPMLFGVAFNLLAYGSSVVLVSAFFYYIFGYFVLGFIAYNVAVLLCTLSGTLLESAAFTAIILAAPTMILSGFNFIMQNFLLGNIYNTTYTNGYAVSKSLVSCLKLFNPILFFYDNSEKYICFPYMQASQTIAIGKVQLFSISNLPVILWAIAGIALAMLSLKLYEKRQAEIAGFIGQNKVLGSICTAVLTFFVFSMITLSAQNGLNNALVLILAGLGAVVAYTACEFLLKQSLKLVLKGAVKLPMHLAICFIIFAVIATGFLGYSTRIPDINDVKSAVISYKGAPDYIPQITADFSSSDGFSDYMANNLIFTSKKDIETVEKLHKAVISAGKKEFTTNSKIADPTKIYVRSDIKIDYTLKNGSKMTRYYDRTTLDVLSQMLILDYTDELHKVTAACLTGSGLSMDNQTAYQGGDIYIFNNMFENKFKVNATTDFRNQLLNAINKDIQMQTTDERYFQEKPAIGILTFGKTADEVPGSPEYTVDPNNKTVFVTDDFINTIAFLKEKGLYDKFANTSEVTGIAVSRFVPNFNMAWGSPSMTYYFRTIIGGSYLTNQYQVTDTNQINEILAKASTNCFAKQLGYLVQIKLKDKSSIIRFLPENEAPDFIKQNVK
jgi:hypothetical protein